MPSEAGAKPLANSDLSGDVGQGAGTEGSSAPAQVERVRVPGDQAASIVRGKDGGAPLTVFVPGVCSNANAYMHAFAEAAKKQGGVVAIEGDQTCDGRPGWHTFSWDATRLHARIEAAFAAAGLTTIPKEGVTLVGYSQGAALGEQLATRYPQRYTRFVLIGAPTDPVPAHFPNAGAVVTMSCQRDIPFRMKEVSNKMNRASIPSTYVEMPGCTHGWITDGDRTFGEAFDFLHEHSRPLKQEAQPDVLVGAVP